MWKDLCSKLKAITLWSIALTYRGYKIVFYWISIDKLHLFGHGYTKHSLNVSVLLHIDKFYPIFILLLFLFLYLNSFQKGFYQSLPYACRKHSDRFIKISSATKKKQQPLTYRFDSKASITHAFSSLWFHSLDESAFRSATFFLCWPENIYFIFFVFVPLVRFIMNERRLVCGLTLCAAVVYGSQRFLTKLENFNANKNVFYHKNQPKMQK